MEKPRKSFKTNISLIKSNKSSCAVRKKARGKFLFLCGSSFDPWRVLNFRNKSKEERLKNNQSRVHVELNHESRVKNDDIESILTLRFFLQITTRQIYFYLRARRVNIVMVLLKGNKRCKRHCWLKVGDHVSQLSRLTKCPDFSSICFNSSSNF